MDSLRLALLVIGAVIVAAVYWNARRKHAADVRNSPLESRIEPRMDDLAPGAPDDERAPQERSQRAAPTQVDIDLPDAGAEAAYEDEPTADAADADQDEESEYQSDVPEKVISLRIVKKDGGEFPAEEVILNLRGVGLQHGMFGIFHRLFDDNSDAAVFSVASLTEPGSFDLQNLKDQSLAGLSFFMLRPGPGRGVDAFDKMIETARAVAISLQGELLDGDGSTMSIQRERFMREELIQYELKHLKL
ncbi:MAG: cell division protein ZipA C-terminal FtsZ-binding domain-containing protein [Pseudomonadota bacterium]